MGLDDPAGSETVESLGVYIPEDMGIDEDEATDEFDGSMGESGGEVKVGEGRDASGGGGGGAAGVAGVK